MFYEELIKNPVAKSSVQQKTPEKDKSSVQSNSAIVQSNSTNVQNDGGISFNDQ